MNEQKAKTYPSTARPWLKYYNDEVFKSRLPECTIYENLRKNNNEHLSDVALEYFGKKVTYGQLIDNIEKAACAFAALGVREGDIVTLCSLTVPETIYSLYALAKIGAICNIIEPRVNAQSIADRINSTDSKVLVILDVFYNKIKDYQICAKHTIISSIADTMPIVTRVGFQLTKGRDIPSVKYTDCVITWRQFIHLGESIDKVTQVSYRKTLPVAIVYTSGTTGTPKGAMLSHDGLNAIAHQYKFIPHERKERFLNIMPPFIAYGLACGIHMPLSLGLTMVIIPAFDPKKFDEYIIKLRPNSLMGVPAHFDCLIKSKKIENVDLSFLKIAAMGGDVLNNEMEKAIEDFLKIHHSESGVYKGYGMTEMSSASAALSPLTGNRLGSIGIPFPYNVISIFEPGTDRELEIGEQGEICITGPSMMLGYYHNEQETNNVLRRHADGKLWAHTQDIGYMDEDGFLYFVDRIKRIIIRPDGHNVWPSQIENILLKHSEVQSCAVVGLPNPGSKNGKIPTAFVVKKHDSIMDEKTLEDELRYLSHSKLPERDCAMEYQFCDALPYTSVGKVDYRALEQCK